MAEDGRRPPGGGREESQPGLSKGMGLEDQVPPVARADRRPQIAMEEVGVATGRLVVTGDELGEQPGEPLLPEVAAVSDGATNTDERAREENRHVLDVIGREYPGPPPSGVSRESERERAICQPSRGA